MKKKLFLIFIFLPIFIFSANVDSAASRAKALQEMQRWYDQKVLYRWGVTDCSHYVQAGMGASGLKLPTGSASNGRYTQSIWNSNTNKIQPGQENLLKPGDLVFFYRKNANGIGHTGMVYSTNDPSCGNGISIIDTYKEGTPPRIQCLSKHTGYVGAISHDEIIRANGHTPVNTDGTIIAPVGSPAGEDTQYYDSGYIIDFDEVIAMYSDVFKKGVKNFESTLIVIMTFIFAITFTLKCLKLGLSNVSVVLMDMKFDLAKFVFFILIIKNYPVINDTALSLCFTLAKAFGSDLNDYKVLNQIMATYIENLQFLIKEFSSELSNIFVKAIQNTMTMINPFKITIIMGSVLYITGIFAYIVFQITKVIMTFIIANSIAVLLLPFWFSDFLKDYFPNPLTVFCKSVLQMFGSIIFISISLKIVDGVRISADSGFDYLAVFTYIVYFTIVACILRKILKGITQIV